jgi:glucose-1-phosphate thymidylyltransferase
MKKMSVLFSGVTSYVNQYYLEKDNLQVQVMSHGFVLLDTGKHEALTEATKFVKAVVIKIPCLEAVDYKMKYLSAEKFK